MALAAAISIGSAQTQPTVYIATTSPRSTIHFSTSSDIFKQIQSELALLLAAPDTMRENLEGASENRIILSEIDKKLQNCHWVFLDLQGFKSHFDSVGTPTQVILKREKWNKDELTKIRTRISSHVNL
ncbi:hypothetical protein ETB97_003161 [Aspergillus alliaceus]|uniref:Uncharacterized protein n=1 Tax=Petromyces alliaceus TaxID=209559 RepID=A0A8H5ZZS5_PETAA|nr:hypothetical protein ETB97_003161 [Aspergillus burnettii]